MKEENPEPRWDEERPWPWLAFRIAISALLITLGVCFGGAMGVLIALPLVALCIAAPLTHALFALFFDLRRASFRDWDGDWYEFEGLQIRVIEEKRCTWVSLPDLLRSLGEPCRGRALQERLATVPIGQSKNFERIGICLSQQAVRDLLASRASPEAWRLARWFEREVFFAHDRRRGRRKGEAAL